LLQNISAISDNSVYKRDNGSEDGSGIENRIFISEVDYKD
jgi:hypothetical protein